MSQFNTTPNKLSKIYDLLSNSDNQLTQKEKEFIKNLFPTTGSKYPVVLYDSDWIQSISSDDTIVDISEFIQQNSPKFTAKKGQKLPLTFDYRFSKDIEIPESLLPYIKGEIIYDTQDPKLTAEGVFSWTPYVYADDFFRIKGDTTLLYQGLTPSKTKYSQFEINNGDLLSQNTSRWFFGTLKYTIGADSYELRSSSIVSIKTYYNVTSSGAGPNFPDWESFECPAIDAISSSSVTGTGTHIVSTMVESPPSTWTQTFTTTKNSTKTVAMFEDVTHITASGSLYKNGIFQQLYPVLNPLTVKFAGSLNGKSTLPAFDGGDATLTSFNYSQEITTIDGIDYDLFKLWYSNKRARWFRFSSFTFLLQNFPQTSDYQTALLPYTKLFVEVNPDDYPEIELDNDGDYEHSLSQQLWSKTNDTTYRFYKRGSFVLSGEAEKESTTQVNFVDEEYAQSGGTYVRVSENRPDKDVPLYSTKDLSIRAKLIISFNSFLFAEDTKNLLS